MLKLTMLKHYMLSFIYIQILVTKVYEGTECHWSQVGQLVDQLTPTWSSGLSIAGRSVYYFVGLYYI